VTALPPPRDLEAPVGELVAELADHLGVRATVDLCVELIEGADRKDHPDAMPYFTGLVFEAGSPTTDPKQWKDYWVRTWGARGLLYVWDDSAAPAVVAGLDDEHWRPGEMCLKVSTKREIGESSSKTTPVKYGIASGWSLRSAPSISSTQRPTVARTPRWSASSAISSPTGASRSPGGGNAVTSASCIALPSAG